MDPPAGGDVAMDPPAGGDVAMDPPAGGDVDSVRLAVAYVAGMTDRFACVQAIARLGWPADRLPRGFDAA
jgi:hypothetical protein